MSDALKPSMALQAKIGSLLIHAEEMCSDDGHEYDRAAFLSGMRDDDVLVWLGALAELSLLPVKRGPDQ